MMMIIVFFQFNLKEDKTWISGRLKIKEKYIVILPTSNGENILMISHYILYNYTW